MLTPEIQSSSSTTHSTSSTETTDVTTVSWIGREITESLDFIKTNVLSTISNITQNFNAEPKASTSISETEPTNPFKVIGNAFSSIFSNITQNFPIASKTPSSSTEEIKHREFPTDILRIIEDYHRYTMGNLLEIIRQDKDIPDDLLKHAKKTDWLDVEGLWITDDQLRKLLDCCENIQSLSFSTAHADGQASIKPIMEKLSSFQKLTNLEISGLFGDDFVGSIIPLVKLQSLKLNYCPFVTDIGISHIVRWNDIHTLKINKSEITDDSLQTLTQLIKLKYLDISYNTKILGEGLKHIGTISTLRHLNLSGNFNEFCTDGLPITDHLVGLYNLTWLSLESCDKINRLDMLNIAKLSELQYLDLDFCEGIEKGSLKLLHPLKKLKTLRVFGTSVNDDDIEDIKKAIPCLNVIKEDTRKNYIAY